MLFPALKQLFATWVPELCKAIGGLVQSRILVCHWKYKQLSLTTYTSRHKMQRETASNASMNENMTSLIVFFCRVIFVFIKLRWGQNVIVLIAVVYAWQRSSTFQKLIHNHAIWYY